MFSPKRKVLFYVPFIATGLTLVYSWWFFLNGLSTPHFQHYFGLLLFVILTFLLKDKTLKRPMIFLGILLLLGFVGIVSFVPYLSSATFTYLDLTTPPFSLESLGLFALYIVLNFDSLSDIYIDYKEQKKNSIK